MRQDGAVRVGAFKRSELIGLDPSDRLAEITSGIAVMLTLLAGTSFYADDVTDPRHVLVGVAIVAALASGLSGGVMNVVEDLYEDAERRRDKLMISSSAAETKRALVREQLEEEFGIEVSDEVADQLVTVITQSAPSTVRVEPVNVRDVVASILLNCIGLVPVLLAFWLVSDWHRALLTADIVLVACLFVTGFLYGSRLRFSPIVCGLAMMLVGVGLVSISSLSDSL